MDLTAPKNISYTFLVHAGSYKDFIKQQEKFFPELVIRFSKQKAIHYYILQVEELNSAEKAYPKNDLYKKLPIMGMREEFSNFVFFKSTKAYNNVLKLMLNGKENTNAPYNLFEEMLTVLEKYRLSCDEEKSISFTILEKKEGAKEASETTKTYYGPTRFEEEPQKLMFEANKIKVANEEMSFAEKVKSDKLFVGIV